MCSFRSNSSRINTIIVELEAVTVVVVVALVVAVVVVTLATVLALV